MDSALRELADAVCADARANVMRGHRTVGTGRIQVSVTGASLELDLAQWKAKATAVLSEQETVELIEKLTTKLATMRAAKKLAKPVVEEDDGSDLA